MNEPTAQQPLRLWPGVVAVGLQWLIRSVVPVLMPGTALFALLGGMVGGLVIVLWWLFFSRARWSDRLGAVALIIVALAATSRGVHESIATGMMGMMLVIYAIPILSLALVAWAVASRGLSDRTRRVTMAASIVIASATLMLVRTGGMTGTGGSDLHWRWSKTPEERLLADGRDEAPTAPAAPAAAERPKDPPLNTTAKEAAVAIAPPAPASPGAAVAPAVKTGGDWPGFRGAEHNSIIRGVRIATDWSASPPVELWRRPIGPGWSSFAVHAGLLYTQEQRGDEEIVACYDVATGKPVWRHRDAARFWESNAGPGPRATPTVSKGRVYALGATGILNVLDAATGSVVWSRNAASDAGAKVPDWGIAASPLVVDDVVVVAASGSLVAYDLVTGMPRWFGPPGGVSYSSPSLLTIDGVAQILQLSTTGATSVALADGKLLWTHSWPGYPIVQPAFTANGDILISVSDSSGTRRLAIAHGPGGWTVEERWTSSGLKPYFNDFVVHGGHAFGFDGNILACIDIEDGKRKWKGGRYGNGQLVLLADQDLLLVLSEEGELALVKATPDQFTEIARFPAIDGKTWNHPVLIDDVLLARNGQEMVAFRLSLAGR